MIRSDTRPEHHRRRNGFLIEADFLLSVFLGVSLNVVWLIGLPTTTFSQDQPQDHRTENAGSASEHPASDDPQAPSPEAARWMPADTVAMARFADVDQFRRQWKKSSFGAQLNDPAFAEFFQSVADRLRGASQGVGIDLVALWQDVEGELSIGIFPEKDGGLSLAVVADLGSDQAARQALTRLEAKMRQSDSEPTRVSVGGKELTSWQRRRDGRTSRLGYFRSGNQIIFGDTLQTLAETARFGSTTTSSTSTPTRPTLADDEVFQHVVDRITPEGDSTGINWYLNPSGIVRTAAGNMTGGVQPATVAAMTQQLGLDQFKGFGGSFWLGQGGMDSVTSTYGYVETPVDGIWKAFTMPATPQEPPEWVTEDVSIYSQVNWNGRRFVDAIGDLVDRAGGEGTWQGTIASAKVGGTDMTVGELAEQLSGPLHISGEIPESAQQLARQSTIFAIGIQDAESIRGLMKAIATEAGAEELSTDSDREAIYQTEFDTSQFPGLPPLEIAVAVTDDALMLSPNADYLQQTLGNRGTQRPLAQSPQYQEIAAQFPAQTAMITYQRQDGRIEGLYEQLRSGILGRGTLPGIAGQLLDLDFESLPPFPAMSRYLQSTGSFVVPTEDGFQIVSFATPPREQ